MRCEFGGLIFGGAYTWRGLFSEFYGILQKMEETCLKTLLDCDRIQSQRRKVIVKMSST